MIKLIWIGLGLPLIMLFALAGIRLIQHDADFSPVALTAAGLYVILAAPVGAWLNARGFSVPRAPGYGFVLLALFGVSMMVRGLGLVRGTAALLVAIAGTGFLAAAAVGSIRTTRKLRGDLVAAARTEPAAGAKSSTALNTECGRVE
jgi:hypothetical protein